MEMNVHHEKIVSLCNRNRLLLVRVACDVINGQIRTLFENIAMHDLMLRHALIEKKVRQLLVIPTRKYSAKILLPFIRKTVNSEMWSETVGPELPSCLPKDCWDCVKKYFALSDVKLTPDHIKRNQHLTFLGLHGKIIKSQLAIGDMLRTVIKK